MQHSLAALALASITLTAAAAHADEANPDRDLTGTYTAEGVQLDGKTPYAGTVTFAHRGGGGANAVAAPTTYDVTWTMKDGTYTGFAIDDGAHVVVGWGETYDLGYYESEQAGRAVVLHSHMELRSDAEDYPEPWGWSATIKKRGKDGWSGSYKFTDEETMKWGSLKLKKHKTGWRYDLAWKDGKKKGTAIAVPLTGDFWLAVVHGTGAFGVVAYDTVDGKLAGRWIVAGRKGEGRETLTRAQP